MSTKRQKKGVVMVVCMIFLCIFSALAVSMAQTAGANLQVAKNHYDAGRALESAESGLEVVRYGLAQITIPGTTSSSDYLTTAITLLQNYLSANNISNIVLNDNGSVDAVTLDTAAGKTFSAQIQIHPSDSNILLVEVTGNCGQIAKTIQVNFDIEPFKAPIFDYGIATKGPVRFEGNPTITGENYNNEADIYIESENDLLALVVSGNTNFEGDISIGNPDGNAHFDGDVTIAGDTGQTAIDNHVFTGTDPVEFPVPNTDHFRQYADGSIINSSTDTSDNMTLSNVRIEAGTDPCFSGNIIIKGVLFIESPNRVQFNGNVDINGLIIADGDADNPGTNEMVFNGNFESRTYPADDDYDSIRSETGSSLLAPGFKVELAGNFASLGGVMAVSGFLLSGNADALITGSIINYSDSVTLLNPTLVEGNARLRFDRSGSTDTPAGFDSNRTLEYDSSSWSMVH